MEIIDMRVRPRSKEFLVSHQPGNVSRVFRRNYQQYQAAERFTEMSHEDLIKEMHEAGITKAVVAAADNEVIGGKKIANEVVADIQSRFPDTFIGFAGVDPRKGLSAVLELEHAIEKLGLKGLNTEPFMSQLMANDKKFYPLYATCAKYKVPVFPHCSINFDPGVVMEYGNPKYLDEVACDFPELIIIARHAGWPWILEMIGVAWRQPNVYVEISAVSPKYLHPELLKYANGLLQDKFLFGTSYPLLPFKKAVQEFMELPLKDAVKEKILYKNAARILPEGSIK